MTGWVFLKRENGGRLFMTTLLGCGDFNDLVPRGYTRPGGYTISQAPYFFSALAVATPDLPETIGSSGYPVQRIPDAMSNLAPSIPQGIDFNYANFPANQGATGQYLGEFQWVGLVFEPWKSGNQIGHIYLKYGSMNGPNNEVEKSSSSFGIPGESNPRIAITKSQSITDYNHFGGFVYPHFALLDHLDFFIASSSITLITYVLPGLVLTNVGITRIEH